ncbi:unnamed protein product [Didymodactylos carnosus]|uniref:Uncharacterized protein n=1 Tax=Didymodactylos carnosus TaxID=1234261 RepID=A0A8S2GTD7_9BILA|nr:unnamed protein product [Didymodactylos carnosus]CAF3558144.1 unnamed protein product [Didymodactylos carnosus]
MKGICNDGTNDSNDNRYNRQHSDILSLVLQEHDTIKLMGTDASNNTENVSTPITEQKSEELIKEKNIVDHELLLNTTAIPPLTTSHLPRIFEEKVEMTTIQTMLVNNGQDPSSSVNEVLEPIIQLIGSEILKGVDKLPEFIQTLFYAHNQIITLAIITMNDAGDKRPHEDAIAPAPAAAAGTSPIATLAATVVFFTIINVVITLTIITMNDAGDKRPHEDATAPTPAVADAIAPAPVATAETSPIATLAATVVVPPVLIAQITSGAKEATVAKTAGATKATIPSTIKGRS